MWSGGAQTYIRCGLHRNVRQIDRRTTADCHMAVATQQKLLRSQLPGYWGLHNDYTTGETDCHATD